MYYGATSRKIRAYFRALRRAARREGGAIGFIEEIDAIAAARRGMRSAPLGQDILFDEQNVAQVVAQVPLAPDLRAYWDALPEGV